MFGCVNGIVVVIVGGFVFDYEVFEFVVERVGIVVWYFCEVSVGGWEFVEKVIVDFEEKVEWDMVIKRGVGDNKEGKIV